MGKKIMLIFTLLWLFTAGVCFSNGLRLTKVGEWGTGDYLRVVVQGNYAYCLSVNRALDILDISNSPKPIRVGSIITTDGYARDLFVSGNYAYIKSSIYHTEDFTSVIRIVDISNPRAPRLLGRHKYLSKEYRAAGSGEFVYVANAGEEILVFNISDMRDRVRRLKIPGKAQDIAISGNYAYIAAGDGGLRIIDITNPPNLNPEGVNLAIRPERVIVSGQYAYLLSDEGIHMVDISNPRHPILKGTHHTVIDEKIVDFTISGNYAYLIEAECRGDCEGKKVSYDYFLKIIDLTGPYSPLITALYFSPKKPISIAIKDQYAYVTLSENGFLIYDVSDPFSPVKVASYDETEYPQNVAVSGNNAYLIGGENKFLVLDISEPSAPKIIGKYLDMPFPVDIAISGDYAYLVDNEKNFHVLDISRPEAPVKVGMYTMSIKPCTVAVSGNHAYVAGSEKKGIEVVNIGNPAQPSREDFWKGEYDDVAVSGDSVYAALSDEYFVDFRNGHCRIYNHIQGICISGEYAFIPATGKIAVVKLSSTKKPVMIKQIYRNHPFDLTVSIDYAFMLIQYNTFVIRNVSNPKYPGPAIYSDAPVNARHVKASGKYAYLTGGDSGKFYIYRVTETSEMGDDITENEISN